MDGNIAIFIPLFVFMLLCLWSDHQAEADAADQYAPRYTRG